MLIIGLITAAIVFIYAIIIVRYNDALLDSDDTFKVFVGGFFAMFVIAGIVMKFTIPSVQGSADIGSIREAIVHPTLFATQQ